jgi:predicted kinase
LSNPYIFITRGLPGSGKSTWADNTIRVLRNVVKVERDEMRQLHFKAYGRLTKEQEEQVTRTQEALVRTYIAAGVTVIISDTHLPDRSVKRWQKIALELGTVVHVEDFRHVPLEKVLANNEERGKWSLKYVPENVIRDMHNRFIKGRDLTKEVVYTPPVEEEQLIIPYEQPDGVFTNDAVIFDIDGTLAVMGDRSPYDGAKVWMDTPNADVVEALRAHSMHTRVIIVSGRDEIYRDITAQWLKENSIHYDELYMRPTENRADGKKTEDSIIKYRLFNEHIRPEGYRIVGVYDDRHRVLRMWRKLGLTTFHVNGPDAGNF